MDYKQPDFYKFSQDSIELSKAVIDQAIDLNIKSLLDIGAGCGVVGIEIANALTSLETITLLEPQNDFLPFIDANISSMYKGNSKFIIKNKTVSEFKSHELFDVIVCNPPYFDPKSGRTSPDKRKQMCRSFEVDSAQIYLKKISELLSPKGIGFILIPNDVEYWRKAILRAQVKLKVIKSLGHVDICSYSAR